jgi:hypothetical protein
LNILTSYHLHFIVLQALRPPTIVYLFLSLLNLDHPDRLMKDFTTLTSHTSLTYLGIAILSSYSLFIHLLQFISDIFVMLLVPLLALQMKL